MSVEKLYYSVDEASIACSIGRTTMYQKINQGEIKAVKFGNKTLIPKGSLDDFLNKLPTFKEYHNNQ